MRFRPSILLVSSLSPVAIAEACTGPDMDAAPLLRNSSSIVREDSGRKLKRLEHFER